MPTATQTHTTPTRRAAIGFSVAAFDAGLAVPDFVKPPPLPWRGGPRPAEGVQDADAELIALCAEYIRRTKDYDTVDTGLESDDDPRWPLLIGAEKRALSLEAQTLQGVLAKAQVALFSAQMVDGSEDFDTGYTGDWPEQVVRDLLRLYGSAVA
jgi:hypothetical protein